MANSDRDGSFQRLSLLYQENARVAAAFWEWQHKTLTIFTAGITALLAIEVWIYNNDLGGYTAIPPVPRPSSPGSACGSQKGTERS